MSNLIRAAYLIPPEVRPDVSAVVTRTRRQLSLPGPDLKYLFEVWNRYLAPADEPQKMTCPGCVTNVVGKLRRYVEIWEQHGINADQ